MSSDLVGGSYPVTYPIWKALGKPANATQANLAARTNLEFLGITTLTNTAAPFATGLMGWVAVPVEIGDPITYVDIWVGTTAATTPTHSFGALYSATGKKLAASADGLTTAIAASAKHSFQLSATHIVASTDAPNGWLYAGYSVTATTLPSVITAGGTEATAAQLAWYTGGPAELAAKGGSALGGTAPATLPTATKLTTVPVVVLR